MAEPWVSVKAVAWVLDEAPVPAELLPTLIAIARRADADGRGARTLVSTVAKNTGKSFDQTQRDVTRLRALGLLVLGDQSAVEHLPSGRRPIVYDIPLHVKGPKPARESRNKSGGRAQPTGMDAPYCMDAGGGMDAVAPYGIHAVPPTGMDAVQKKTLNKTKEETSSSARRSPTVALIADRLSIDDDDASLIIQEIKTRHRPKSIGGYVRRIPDDDLRELLVEIKDRHAAAAAADDGLEPVRVGWCGTCDEHTRTLTIPRENGRGPFAKHCPDCSPRRVRRPRTNGGAFDPAAAYARALAREQAHDSRRVSTAEELADWEVDRVGGPYRNPVDQDAYDGWLADRPPERRPARRAGYGGPYRDDRVRDYHSPL